MNFKLSLHSLFTLKKSCNMITLFYKKCCKSLEVRVYVSLSIWTCI